MSAPQLPHTSFGCLLLGTLVIGALLAVLSLIVKVEIWAVTRVVSLIRGMWA